MTLQRKVYGDARQIEKSPHSEAWGNGMRRSVGLKFVNGRSSTNARCVSDSSKFAAAQRRRECRHGKAASEQICRLKMPRLGQGSIKTRRGSDVGFSGACCALV